MNLTAPLLIAALTALSACTPRAEETVATSAEAGGFGGAMRIQFFNESVLSSHAAEANQVLMPAVEEAWGPNQVSLDFKESRCYGATVRYPKSGSFEDLREAINTRFKKWESKDFASDSTMGMWRNEDAKFAIQLTEDDDDFVVIYIEFVESGVLYEKTAGLLEDDPVLLKQVVRDLRDDESLEPEDRALFKRMVLFDKLSPLLELDDGEPLQQALVELLADESLDADDRALVKKWGDALKADDLRLLERFMRDFFDGEQPNPDESIGVE